MNQQPETRRMYGFMLATVLSNNDGAHKGMLKIRLLCEGGSKNILEGVKVAAPFTGDKYGMYALPEIGEQVLVGFIDGCYDRPFVIGSVYTAKDAMLSESYHKDNMKKRLKTKGGCILEISDEGNKESVTIKTPKNLSVKMEEEPQSITLTAGKTTVTIDGKKGSVHIKAEKEIKLETGSASVTLTSSGDITSKGNKIEGKGTSSIKLDSSGTLNIKGQKVQMEGAITDVKSTGILTLKGSLTKIN